MGAIKSRIYVSKLHESVEKSGALSCSPRYHVDDELLNFEGNLRNVMVGDDQPLEPSNLNIGNDEALSQARNKRTWVVNGLGHLSMLGACQVPK